MREKLIEIGTEIEMHIFNEKFNGYYTPKQIKSYQNRKYYLRVKGNKLLKQHPELLEIEDEDLEYALQFI